MCGIFAYISYNIPLSQKAILEVLLNGLHRLEYRGYDSAGLCIDGDGGPCDPVVIKSVGTVSLLEDKVNTQLHDATSKIGKNVSVSSHVGVAHTRWATHGKPSEKNSHPHYSDDYEFVVVHNGIITNYSALKEMLQKKGYTFYSETDTEIVAKITKFLYDQLITEHPGLTFVRLVMHVMLHLEGAFALIFRSTRYPNEVVACKRGSPLVIGLRGASVVEKSFIQVSSGNITVGSELASAQSFGFQSPDRKRLRTEKQAYSSMTASLAQSKDLPLPLSPRIKRIHAGRKESGANGHLVNGHAATVDGGMVNPKLRPEPTSLHLANSMFNEGPGYSSLTCSPNLLTSPNKEVNLFDDTGRMEYFFSSDASAIVEHTQKVFYTEENDIVAIRHGELFVYNQSQLCSDESQTMVNANRQISTLKMELDEIMKGSFPHFMMKEIFEQPESVRSTMRGRVIESSNSINVHLTGVRAYMTEIQKSTRLIFVACGTSYHACLATRQILEELSHLPVVIELAGDFLDRSCPIFRSDVVVFVSQSGETADTLEALKYVRKHGALCMGLVNVVGSTISRVTDFGVHLNAGSEIGVASTKVYTSQIVAIIMVALELSVDSVIKAPRRREILEALLRLPEDIERTIKMVDEPIMEIASRLVKERSILLFGRGYQYATCLEGALKIKEVAYIHTEGINAGELKHGPLALVDESMPIFLFSNMDKSSSKIHNAVQQLMARGGLQRMVVICSEQDHRMLDICKGRCEVVQVSHSVDCLQPVMSIIPMQLLSYRLAVARGLNVDQPRNLAKSVTVE